MDIWKKMFQADKPTSAGNNNNKQENEAGSSETVKDEFRKPQWFEESETDDELFDDDRKFAFQVFTNPLEVQKHFEQQMQRILEAMSDYEDGLGVEKNLKEEFLKPGFESKILKEFEKQAKANLDTDLDGEIYPDQLHSIMQRLNPSKKVETEELPKILPGNDMNRRNGQKSVAKERLTDEQRIMGKIHGTLLDDDELAARKRSQRGRPDAMAPMTPMIPRGIAPFGGVFEGAYQGPKMFSQSVMTKTVRKPDGSYETTKITQDSSGKKVTTVTRLIDGKTETITTYDGGNEGHGAFIQKPNATEPEVHVYSDRNIMVKEGYALPRNLW